MIKFREVLSNRNFFFLWVGQLISTFGDRLTQMALVALVYQQNPGSEIALAKLISFTIIPVFIIGPIAGVWIDRLNRKNVMVISDIFRGCLILSIPFFIGIKQILFVYLAIFLTFSISRFFIPSKMAIIPDLVPKENLLVANTLSGTTYMIGNVVGLIVAGIIVNTQSIGAIGGFYIDSMTFFVSALLIAMIAHVRSVKEVSQNIITTTEAISSSLRRSIAKDIIEGLKTIWRYGDMRFIVSVFFILMTGLGAVSCVIIVFVQHAFGTSTRDLGFLGTFLVTGLFIGTMLYGKFGQGVPKRKVVFYSFIASGIFITVFALVVEKHPNLLTAGVISALLGAAASPIMISANTLTHEAIPEELRGRIFSSLEVVIHLGFMVAMFLAAYAAKYIGRLWVIMIAGAVFYLCGAVGLAVEAKNKATCS
ncbi:MAG: MFS transporter [Candidatus Omnitrophica bacterium]|nr:MFS transporter [Candidatus Omnitrophota bacterium]